MQLTRIFLHTALFAHALAKAPLLHRDVENSIDDNYIVAMRQTASPAQIAEFFKSLDAASTDVHKGLVRTYQNIQGMTAFHVECNSTMLDIIRHSALVDYVAPDATVSSQAALSRPRVHKRETLAQATPIWGLGRISHRASGVIPYVDQSPPKTYLYMLDTGILTTHVEFGGRAIWGANFVTGSPDEDQNGHGTHTAATASGNNVGVDNSTTPIAVKCLDQNEQGSWSGVLAAIDWAVGDATKRGAIRRSVINMSLGAPTYQPLDDMVQKAYAAGMTVVVAASNYAADACGYSPARGANAITVAAIDQTDARPSWSNYGACVDTFAPGNDITSAWPGSTNDVYAVVSGTSMASPHVAGLATYLMSREGLQGPDQVAARLAALATTGSVVNAGVGSPNRIAFNGYQ